jgi:hypothetical protein
MTYLVNVFGLGKISQRMSTKVSQYEGVLTQLPGYGLGDEDLAAMGGSHKTRRSVDSRPEIVIAALDNGSDMQSHSHRHALGVRL